MFKAPSLRKGSKEAGTRVDDINPWHYAHNKEYTTIPIV